MRHLASIAAVTAFTVFGIVPPAAQALNFSRLGTGPDTPVRQDTVRDGNTLYAMAGHFIFKSSDGSTWALIAGQPPLPADNLAFAGGRLISRSGKRLYASANEGTSWTDITGNLSSIQAVYGGAGSVFVVTAKSEGQNFVYRLHKGDGLSATWTEVFNNTDGISNLVQAGTNLCFGAGNGGIRFSNNGGNTWASATGANGSLGVLGVSPDGSTVLASSGTNALSVSRSLNGCQSFFSLGAGAPSPNNASLTGLGVDSAGNYYAGFADGSVLKRPSGGSSFAADNSGDLPVKTQVGIFDFIPYGAAVLARTGSGFYSNAGGSWAAASAGISTSFNNGLIARDASADAIGVATAGYFVSDAPASAPFAARNNGLESRAVNALLRSGEVLLAGTQGFIPSFSDATLAENGLFRSTDDGNNWTRLGTASGLPAGASVGALASDGTHLFAAVTNAFSFNARGVYKSADAGLTWSAVSGVTNTSVRNMAGKPGELFVYIGQQGVFKVTGGGTSVTAINNGLSGTLFGKVFAYSGGLIASAGGAVYRSPDGPRDPGSGAIWTRSSGFAVSRFGIEILSLAEDAAGVLYLGDEHAGLSVSTDGGATWTPDSDGLVEAEVCIPRIQNLLVRNGKLYVGSGGTGIHVSDVIGSAAPGDSVSCTTDTDIFPNAFTFTAQTNVTPNTVLQSNTVAITGIANGVTLPVSIVGGEYSIGCNGSFTSQPGSMPASTICVRHTTPATGETRTTTLLNVGDQSAEFVSATGLVYTGRADEINTSFGTNGFASLSNTTGVAEVRVLGDGRVAVAGTAQGSGGFSDNDFALSLRNADGTPVSAFGTNGRATVNLGGNDTVVAVLPQTDGKFVLVGYSLASVTGGTTSRAALARLNADGTRDSSFGTDGIVLFDIHPTVNTNRFELIGDALLLADGSILIGGGVLTDGAGTQFFAVKFSGAGVVDTGFGVDNSNFADGVASSGSLGTTSVTLQAMALQSTGKILLAGTTQPSFSTLAGTLVRFNTDGTLDTSFNTTGRLNPAGIYEIRDMLVGSNDNIVVFGGARDGNPVRPMVARLGANGAFDNGFAGDGLMFLPAVSGYFTSGELLTDGSIAAFGGGTAPDGTQQLLYAHILANGELDTAFGTNNQGYLFRGPVNGSAVSGVATALRGDGGVVVAGFFGTSNPALFVFGGGSGPVADTTPEAFSFAAQTGVEPMATVTSASATITGITAPAPVTVSGGSYSIGCGTSFVSSAGSITDGQSICVRHTAAIAFSADTTTTLSIGGVSASFTSTTRAGNSTPNDFEFADASNVPPSTVVMSSAVAISGNEAPAAVSVQNGEYAIGCSQGTFTTAAGSISAGQVICVRHTSAATPGGMVNTTLTVGGKSDVFTSTVAQTPPPDTTPNSFSFVDVSDVAPSTEQVSNPFTVSGINAPAPISVSGGEYRINNGAFTSASGTVLLGDAVRVRHTSAAAPGTAVNTTLNVGGVSDTFTSTTAAGQGTDTTPAAFSFVDRSGVAPNSQVTSNPIRVTGINAPAPISVSGGVYRIGNSSFTSLAGTVNDGDNVELRVTAGPAGATVSATLSIGGVSDTFSVSSAMQSGGGTVNDPQGRPVNLASSLGAITGFQSIPTPTGAISIQGAQYPNGFFSYNVTGLPNGGTAQVSFTLPTAGANAYVKCDSSGNCVRLPNASVTVNGRTMTISMLDGGPFDEDGVANGTIVDPGAPAIITSETEVESGGGAFGAAGLLLALPALLRRRRALGLLALLAALPAAAEGTWYAGLRGGSAGSHLDSARVTAELQSRGHNVTATVDERAAGGTLYVGYRLEPAAALEFGLMHAGEFATRITGAPVDAQRMADDAAKLLGGSGNAVSAALRFDIPLAGALDLSPRLGAYAWRTDVAVSSGGARTEGSEEGLGALIGMGLSLRLPAGWRAGLGYELLRSTSNHSIEQFQAQLEYHWGS